MFKKSPIRIEHWFKSGFANKGIQVSLSSAVTDLTKKLSVLDLFTFWSPQRLLGCAVAASVNVTDESLVTLL